MRARMCVCVCARASVRACVCVRARTRARVYARSVIITLLDLIHFMISSQIKAFVDHEVMLLFLCRAYYLFSIISVCDLGPADQKEYLHVYGVILTIEFCWWYCCWA